MVLNHLVLGQRPTSLVVVVGTGTEVGKTWVSAQLLSRLGATKRQVGARKLAQSHDPGDAPASLDAAILAQATGEEAEVVCPDVLTFPIALAPPMAAEALGRPVPNMEDLLEFSPWADHLDVGLVETAGGLRSPQAADGDALDVVSALSPDQVILVALAELGTISTIRLCHDALRARSTAPVLVVVNRFDPGNHLHRRNVSWLRDIDRFEVITSPGGLDQLADRVSESSSP